MATYPPLNVLKPVGKRIWIVDSGPLHAVGIIPLPVRMTVMQLNEGGLLLHSPTQCNSRLRDELKNLGPVRHLVAPNSAHWTFVKDWTAHFPDALAWSAPGLRQRRQVKRAAIAWHDDLGASSQALWAPDIEQIEVPGIGGFREVCFFHRPSGSLVLTDLVQNLDEEHMSALMRLLSRLVGTQEKAPVYLRLIVKLKGKDARDAAARLMSLQPDRVIFSHGAWFEHDASERLRKSLDWLT
jgi:hypothetical protein